MKLKRLPKRGDIRERIKFAWLPTECDDGVRLWLEYVHVVECYSEYVGWVKIGGRPAPSTEEREP